jgi:hypothetical protein
MQSRIFVKGIFAALCAALALAAGCETPPPPAAARRLAFVEFFIPSAFMSKEEIQAAAGYNFNVYVDGMPYSQGLKLKKKSWDGLYTLVYPSGKDFSSSRGEAGVPLTEGWHQVNLSLKDGGEESVLPLRLTGKMTSGIKDEPSEETLSKMFVIGGGPGSSGQYFAQLSMKPVRPMAEVLSQIKQKPPVYGFVSVSSQPQAEVYLDGDFIGTSPLEKLKMTEGRHSLELRKEGFKTWTKELRVIADSQVPVQVTLEKEAYIDKNWQEK